MSRSSARPLTLVLAPADEEGFRWEPNTGLPEPLGLEEALAQSMGRAASKEPGLAKQVRHTYARTKGTIN